MELRRNYFGIGIFLIAFKGLYTTKLPDVDIIKSVALSSSKIQLSWKPNFQLKKGDLRYIIRFKEDGERFQRITSSRSKFVLKDLKPDMQYTIAVRATKDKRRGDWSKSVIVKTLPQAVTIQDEDLLDGNVTVDDIDTNKANIVWTLGINVEQINDFKGYRVVWKNKKNKEDEETLEQNFTLTDLEPVTRYVVNVYVLTENGARMKVGNVKFTTKDEEMKPPKNFRIMSISDTTIDVRWRRVDRNNPDSPITGYLLEYKRRGNVDADSCMKELNKTAKTYLFQGLLPDTKYGIRLAGIFGNVTGPYSDWLKVKTEPFESNKTNVRIYHISTTEILILWKPTLGLQFRTFDIYKKEDAIHTHIYHTESTSEDQSETPVFVKDLEPDSHYELIITEYASVDEYRERQCPRNTVAYFTTQEGNCDHECQQDDDDSSGISYDPFLRLLPLPGQTSHLITWSTDIAYISNTSYFYVIKILGEPFLSHLHSFYIPEGKAYHVINGLDPDKPYSICLLAFEIETSRPVFESEYLLILPRKDILSQIDTNTNWTMNGITAVSSMDLFSYDASGISRDQYQIDDDQDLIIQNLEDYNVTLISKIFPDNTVDEVEDPFTKNETREVYSFLQQVKPEVHTIDNVTLIEGEMADITCLSRGDPYPMITWIDLTTNESIVNVNTSSRLYTSKSKYVGSTRTVNSRTYFGVKGFLTIQNANLSESGVYACAAENTAGIDLQKFYVTVLPGPPGKVKNLASSALTPFDIRVTWQPPEEPIYRQIESPVTGYRVVLLDEFDVMMREKNTTTSNSTFTELQPNTVFKILVSAYHKHGEGRQLQTETKTRRIPILGPVENVNVVTLNSTIMRISWDPPIAVATNQVRLRKYLMHVRKVGTRKSIEKQVDRESTEQILYDLEPEQYYEFQIIGVSEDGQVSFSEWTKGSTYREAYMDESRPPPPPYNVYLRPEGDNIIVSWLPPRNDANVIVRGYAITVLNNGTKRESMEVGYKESSVIIYEVDTGVLYQIAVQTKNNAGFSIEQWEEIYIPQITVSEYPVENFRGRAVNSTDIQLQWGSPGDGSYTHFILSYKATSDNEESSELQDGGILPSHVRSYIVRSLKPFTEYFFEITPYFKRMEGVSTNTSLKTLSDRPSNPPENVVLTGYNSTTILLECEPPTVGKNGVIISYKVSYRTKTTRRNDQIFPAIDNQSLSSHVTGLLPSTLYEFRIRALTINGSGPWSDWKQIRTSSPVCLVLFSMVEAFDPIIPKVPQNLTSISTETAILLSWQPPDQNSGHIAGYVVGYGKFIPEVNRLSVTKDTYAYALNDLKPGSMYIISVRSFNEYGESAAVFDVISTKNDV